MDMQQLVDEIVARVLKRLEQENIGLEDIGRSARVSAVRVGGQLLSEQGVREAERLGQKELIIGRRTIVTDLAREYAQKRGIALIVCD